MSSGARVLRRPGSMGWLVLGYGSFRLSAEDPVVQRILELIDQGRPMLLLEAGSDSHAGTDFPEWMSELIGQPLVSLTGTAENAAQIREAWLNAGLIYLAGGTQEAWKQLIGEQTFQGYPEEILTDASVMIAGGMSSGVFGTWMLDSPGGELVSGLGWLEGGVIMPGEASPSSEPAVLELLEGMEPAYALGLPADSHLALGPDGEIEVWSEAPPAILLGRGWLASDVES
jgi:hypothetical protein